MSSLRVAAARTFADENALQQQDRVTAKPSGVSTRPGLGAAAPNKASAPPASQPLKPSKLSTRPSTTPAATARRALGDITNAKSSQPQPNPATTPNTAKPNSQPTKPTTTTTTAVPHTALVPAQPAAHPASPPPIEHSLGLTWRQQEVHSFARIAMRRDSLTGLTPVELATSIRGVLAASEGSGGWVGSEADRVMGVWEGGLDMDGVDGCGGGGGGGGVDESKVRALLDLDLDIDLGF